MGMAITHAIASGTGGMRAAGDLVARMQLNRGMRIDAAKSYVADKIGASVPDLADSVWGQVPFYKRRAGSMSLLKRAIEY